MHTKVLGIGILLGIVAVIGYAYFLPLENSDSLTNTDGPAGNIDALVAAVLVSAESEASVVAGDDADITAVEEQAMDITSTSELYVQGEF